VRPTTVRQLVVEGFANQCVREAVDTRCERRLPQDSVDESWLEIRHAILGASAQRSATTAIRNSRPMTDAVARALTVDPGKALRCRRYNLGDPVRDAEGFDARAIRLALLASATTAAATSLTKNGLPLVMVKTRCSRSDDRGP